MIGFIKRKVWVYQLAEAHESYDNRDIKGQKPTTYTVLDKIIIIK